MEPNSFAQDIRDLAHDAHRALTRPSSNVALWHLARRAERLASSFDGRPESQLMDWLGSLERRLRSAAIRQAGAARRLCVHA